MKGFFGILTFLFFLKEVPEIIFKSKELPAAVFSHRVHAGVKNMGCEFCHTGKVAFSSKENKNCIRCHNAKK